MRYAVSNLGQSEPERFVPDGPADCSSVDDFRKAVDNAAARIAYYNQAMQRAAASENYGAVERARAGADLANRDWEIWSKEVRRCEAPPAETPAGAAAYAQPKGTFGVLLALGALVAVTAVVIATPKLHSIRFWKTGGK